MTIFIHIAIAQQINRTDMKTVSPMDMFSGSVEFVVELFIVVDVSGNEENGSVK